jgi:hypothetical protein
LVARVVPPTRRPVAPENDGLCDDIKGLVIRRKYLNIEVFARLLDMDHDANIPGLKP